MGAILEMIEVEIKVLVLDVFELVQQMKKIGFTESKSVKESDFYFDNESSQIKTCDAALRIRSCENLKDNTSEFFMTYKGPKMDRISMTRNELEMKIEDMDTAKDILMSLGYIRIYPVIKERKYFYMDQVTACLDQVENLGDFLELEIVVVNECEKEQALTKLLDLIKKLGYESKDLIRKSYLSMLLMH